MAQSALTVTTPNPTPPTNMSSTGATGPNPPNYTKTNYAEPFGARDANGNFTDETPPGVRVNPNPPPYFDDGAAGSLVAFAANTAALAGGTGVNSGGTEGTYPGAAAGAVPAATSVAHEGAGTEAVDTVVYPPAYTGAPVHNPTITVGVGPVATPATRAAGPNANHPSYLTGTAGVGTPTTSATSAGGASGAGTTALTVTGTNFNRSSVVYVDGVAQNTNYVSASSLTVTNAPKKATAGNRSVTVVNGVGGTPSNATNWVFS